MPQIRSFNPDEWVTPINSSDYLFKLLIQKAMTQNIRIEGGGGFDGRGNTGKKNYLGRFIIAFGRWLRK